MVGTVIICAPQCSALRERYIVLGAIELEWASVGLIVSDMWQITTAKSLFKILLQTKPLTEGVCCR